jgi:TIR domain/Pentapeptide repeats (8 copies)
MANPEHLKLLIEGVAVWNKWIEESFRVNPDLSGANLSDYKLNYINLSSANLAGANLNKAELLGANFNGAILDRANLYGSLLQMASFVWARLDNTNLGRSVIGGTVFGFNDLSLTIGLDTVRHNAPSAISVDTLYKSKGNIPEVFLRGCGVPENLITYMHSLTGQALEFYKCFISFTEADDAFSERLYNDLQANGVRCWRWKEDAKWGKTLMRSIDEAVRLYDKLIIICSEQSLNSPAVIREIERALQKEDDLARQGKESEVSFPIRLDDYIFTGWNHHRKADVIAKNVGDFTRWKDHDSYRKALERLLRDLKDEEDKKSKSDAASSALFERAVLSPRNTFKEEWEQVESSIVEAAKRDGLINEEDLEASKVINKLFETGIISEALKEEFYSLNKWHYNVVFFEFSSVEPSMAISFVNMARDLQSAVESACANNRNAAQG